jgi:hypothetical protein
VSVTLTPINGKATAGQDYTAGPIAVTFNAGEAFKNVNIPILNDTLSEPNGNESVILTLSNPTGGATLNSAAGTAILEIEDDDNPGKLEFAGPTFRIAEDGTVLAAIKVKRTEGSSGELNGSITLAPGTTGSPAAAGVDFNAGMTIPVSFEAGESGEKAISIPAGTIIDDTAIEGLKTVQLTLGSPSVPDTIGPVNTATLEVEDNDLPTVQIEATDPQAAETPAGTPTEPAAIPANPGQFTVTRYLAGGITPDTSETPLTVSYTLDGSSGSTAINGTDYTATPALTGTITIPGGSATATIDIEVIDELLNEGDEGVTLSLNPNPETYNVGTAGSATVTIADNDVDSVKITAIDAQAAEEGLDAAQFLVTVINPITGAETPAKQDLTVKYSVGGSATPASDYDALTGAVTIRAGQTTSDPITLTPREDSIAEEDESAIPTLMPDTTYNVDPNNSSATMRIADNEQATVIILATDVRASELDPNTGKPGTGEFLIQRLGSTADSLTVNYTIDQTGSNSAISGTDYLALSGSVTIEAGEREVYVKVEPINDTGSEPEPTYDRVDLVLGQGAGYLLGDLTTASVFIQNNGI